MLKNIHINRPSIPILHFIENVGVAPSDFAAASHHVQAYCVPHALGSAVLLLRRSAVVTRAARHHIPWYNIVCLRVCNPSFGHRENHAASYSASEPR